MSSDIKQQILRQIEAAQNILICFKNIKHGAGYPAGGDAVASALALGAFLRENGKNTDIASPDFYLPKPLSFLPGAEIIKNSVCSARQAKIRINIKNSGVKNFSYDTDDEFLNIYFSPEESFIDLKNLETCAGAWAYDLIIALDTAAPALLGDIYIKNKPLFDAAPIINIDDSPENEHYGEINLADIKSSSVAEIVWQIIKESPHLDKNIIDCILAGIIAKTKNFRRPNIGPKTLEIAGELISLGANRQNIVENFYRTKSVEALRLWGRALARLKHEDGIVWSVLQRADFIHSGAVEAELEDVIHELISNSPNAKTIALIFEGLDSAIKTITYSNNKLTHSTLREPNLILAEKELLAELKKGE